MQPAKQFDLCPWNKLIALPHVGWQHAGWFASYVVNAKNILEWGCGGSTLWMAMMNVKGRLTSIEHDSTWADRLNEALVIMRDELAWRCSGEVWVYIAHILTGAEVEYVRHPGVTVNAPYDLIFVDGHERPACLAASYDLLAPGGVVFLHDSERTEYVDAKRMLLEREGMILIDERVDESWVNPIAGMWAGQKS